MPNKPPLWNRIVNFGYRLGDKLIRHAYNLTYRILTFIYNRSIRLLNFLHHSAVRALNRLYGVLSRLPKTAYNLTLLAANSAALLLYRAVKMFARKKTVPDSVLHVSLISNKQYMLTQLFRMRGIKSAFLALNADLAGQLSLGYDYGIPHNISIVKRVCLEFWYLWTVLSRYDVIHFHFNTLLTRDVGWELPYLKRMGKVLVFQFRGCDLRRKSLNLAMNPTLNCCQECGYPEGSCDTDYQQARLQKALDYGDLFFVTTPDLRDFLPQAEHIPFIIPYAIDLDGIEAAEKNPGIFRVVTSSNHPGVDGVPYIRQAVERLRQEGHAIELVEINKLPYRQALSVYKSADLYAGKLRMGYYNNANIETMLMGIPNMAYIRPEFMKYVPDCPIIITRPDTIYRNLLEWINKPQELKKIGQAGPAFVEKYHGPDKIFSILMQKYNEAFSKKASEGKS